MSVPKFQIGHRYLVKTHPYCSGVTSIVVQETVEHDVPGLVWVFFRYDISGAYEWSDTLLIIKELPIKEEAKI